MNQQEILNTIALTRINYFTLSGLLELYRELGSATAVIEHRHNIKDILPNASQRLIDALQNLDEPLKGAEVEMEFDSKHDILPLCLIDPRYPQRLKDCPDVQLFL